MRATCSTLVATLLLGSAPLGWGSDCPSELVLAVPPTVELGGSDEICLCGPDGAVTLLMASLGPGPTDSPYGTLYLDFPLLLKRVVNLPTGQLCLPFTVPDDPAFTCLTIYLQALMCDPNRGVSNPGSITLTDGICEGDFCSYTPGGWGTTCSGDNPGCLRDAHFASVFPSGLILGDQDNHPDEFSVLFETSEAVRLFLPATGTVGTLAEDAVNPQDTAAGVLAGHLLAAKLSVGFDHAGVFDAILGSDGIFLGDLVFVDCVDSDLVNLTVRQVIALADDAISGKHGLCLESSCQSDDRVDADGNGVPDVSLSDLSAALDLLNNAFDGCQGTGYGCLDYTP